MLRRIISNWWILNIRGIFAIAFGILTLFLAGRIVGEFGEPMTTVSVLALFILYLVFMQHCRLLLGARVWALGNSVDFTSSCCFYIFFAGCALFSPHLTMALLLYFLIAHSLLVGISEVVFTLKLRKHPVDQLLLELAACLSFITGVVLYLARNAEVEDVIRSIGLYTITFGVIMVLFSIRLHAFHRPAARLAHPH